MKAIALTAPGGPDMLAVTELPQRMSFAFQIASDVHTRMQSSSSPTQTTSSGSPDEMAGGGPSLRCSLPRLARRQPPGSYVTRARTGITKE